MNIGWHTSYYFEKGLNQIKKLNPRSLVIDLKNVVLCSFILFSLPIPPRQIPDLVGHRTVGAEAMGELVSRQEPYYANTDAVPGCIKTP